jgi:hypothetical protein
MIERERFRGRLRRLFADVHPILMPVSSTGTATHDRAAAAIEHDVEGASSGCPHLGLLQHPRCRFATGSRM